MVRPGHVSLVAGVSRLPGFLFDMFPIEALTYLRNHDAADTKLVCNYAARATVSPDRPNVGLAKHSFRIVFPDAAQMAAAVMGPMAN